MATGTVIPVTEYLKTAYRPDCDYVNGELQERNLGEFDHSAIQRQFLRLLDTIESERYLSAYQELRVQVSATCYRVPDLCVRLVHAPREQIIRTPPLLCIEILSPEDTLSNMRKRAQDYFDMGGVPEVWIVDPAIRGVHLCTATTITDRTAGLLTISGTPVTVALAEIFSALDPK